MGAAHNLPPAASPILAAVERAKPRADLPEVFPESARRAWIDRHLEQFTHADPVAFQRISALLFGRES